MREPSTDDVQLAALTVEGLLTRLRTADEETSIRIFTELVTRFEGVVRKGWSKTRAIEYPEFVNEVFKRALGALPTLREPLAFPLFFKNVVRSVAGDLMRETMKSPEQLDAVTEAVEAVENEITVPLIVRSYLEYLTEQERDVLELEYIAGFTTQEVATKLGLAPGYVRVLRSRALRRLRKVVDRDRRMLERLQER
jgi:RNA polymerase sigma factor (sigma-70 family)